MAGRQPVHGAEAEANEVVIDDAEIVAVEVAPDDRDEGRRDDHRQKVGEPEEIEQDGRHPPVQRQREQHADANVAGHGKEGETQGVPEDLQRPVVGEEAPVIVEADPSRPEHRIVVGETQDTCDEDRREDEDEVERERRQHQEITCAGLRVVEFGRLGHDGRVHRSGSRASVLGRRRPAARAMPGGGSIDAPICPAGRPAA